MVTNYVLAVLYAAGAVFFAVRFAYAFKRRKEAHLMDGVCFVAASLLFWSLTRIAFHLVPAGPEGGAEWVLAVLFRSLDTPAKVFIVTAILIYVLRFYRYKNYTHPVIISVLMIFPAASLMWVALTPWFSLFRANQVIRFGPNVLYGDFTAFAVFSIVYCFGVLILSIYVAAKNNIQIAIVYRMPSQQLVYAVLWMSLAMFLFFLPPIPFFPLDYTLIVAVLFMHHIHTSGMGMHGMEFLRRARDEVFDRLEERILILDDATNIVSANKSAVDWLKSIGFRYDSQSTISYASVQAVLQTKSVKTQKQTIDNSIDYYFDDGGTTKAYNLQKQIIKDSRDKKAGTLVIYSDVTENRSLLHRLEVSAGRDALTGLANRNMMEKHKAEIDKAENFPVSVVLCDLNNLKKVNDDEGHQLGDLMIRMAGEALLTCCPPNATPGRIGGDEFLVLLPHCNIKQAEDLIQLITRHLESISQTAPIEVCMAMGAAVKETDQISMETLIADADAVMYENKRKMKLARGQSAEVR